MKRLAILAAVATLAACDDTNVHLLYGQQYESKYGCMMPEQSIDIINGPDPGQNCKPTCVTAQLDGETNAFITTTCPPYDPYPSEQQPQTHGPSDPCTEAFKVYAANIECGPDGGPPEGGLDAGTDAEAGFDATVDAPSDAPAEAAPEAAVDASEAAVEASADAGLD